MIKKIKEKINLQSNLFLLSILVCLICLIFKIEDFPIYFFVDEAIQVLRAEEILRNGFRNSSGEFLPLIMRRFTYWDLGLTVYLNMPAMILLGKSIWAVRATTVILALMGGIYTSFILKNIFKVKNYWLGLLLLISTPIFYLHARTGFEIVIAVSFYAGFLYYYMLYRNGKPHYLLYAIFFAGLSFYSVNAVWLVVATTLALLAIIDLPYHLKYLRNTVIAALFALVIFSPFVYWQYSNFAKTVRVLSKYKNPIAREGSLSNGAYFMVNNYLLALSPEYLFSPVYQHHPRHDMKGYGNFSWWSIPFILIGLIYAIMRIRHPAERTLLVFLFTSPLGGAIAGPGSTRILPIAIVFTCLIGIAVKIAEKFISNQKTRPKLQNVFTIMLFLSLNCFIFFMVNDSLKNGPFWYRDYGLFGMQYGAKELFREAIPEFLKKYPKYKLFVSPNWANGADAFADFFLDQEEKKRIEIGGISAFITEFKPIPDNLVLVMTPEDLNTAKESAKFKRINILQILPYPDDQPGFYFAKLTYVDDIEQIFENEFIARYTPITEVLLIDGQPAFVTFTSFSEGSIYDIFDNDPFTFVRGWDTSTLSLQLDFPEPRDIHSVTTNIGIIRNFDISLSLKVADQIDPLEFNYSYESNINQSTYTFNLAKKGVAVQSLRVNIKDREIKSNIHVFDLTLK